MRKARQPDLSEARTALAPSDRDRLRLLTKVARMYHNQGLRQPEIASRLHISQPRVSRLLRQAGELGVVRTMVVTPGGVHIEIEQELERRFALDDVVVADAEDDVGQLLLGLGAATAAYLEATLPGGDRIGVSSWSSSLLAGVDMMSPRALPGAERVVQALGGIGFANAQPHATRLIGRLANLTHAEAIFLPVPALVASRSLRNSLHDEPSVRPVLDAYPELTMALVGIGTLEPSQLIGQSGNAISIGDQQELHDLGAVGDICLRFFDSTGALVGSSLEDRVIGISADQLRALPRIIGVAGGSPKYTAIRAALIGGWLTVLITDLGTAKRLLSDPQAVPRGKESAIRASTTPPTTRRTARHRP